LDDDSYPLERDAVARIRKLFEQNPRLAVAEFPQRTDENPETLTATEFPTAHFIGSYANSGAAIRQSVFEALGGYPDFFFHAYEEPDFALRCLAAGWETRFEPSLTVRHHWTALMRNEIRTHHRHARNEVWSAILRCPWPWLPWVLLFRLMRQALYAVRRGKAWIVAEPQWWHHAVTGWKPVWEQRQPVPWRTYLAWMRLVRAPHDDRAKLIREFGSFDAF
jgi:GT2 family glycosyltransferase